VTHEVGRSEFDVRIHCSGSFERQTLIMFTVEEQRDLIRDVGVAVTSNSQSTSEVVGAEGLQSDVERTQELRRCHAHCTTTC